MNQLRILFGLAVIALCLALQSCELFTDDEVHFSIINQSKDTVYISDQVGPPTMILPSVGNFCLLSPEAREDGITGMFDYSDWRIRVSVVRKTVADAHPLEKVIENFMYDTIYVTHLMS